jgi:hypothetical protein
MNDHELDDPRLVRLEAQLTAIALDVSPVQKEQLLYQCGLAAGRASRTAPLRRWRLATLLSLIAVAVIGSLDERSPNITQAPSVAVERHRPVFNVKLDAWQAPTSGDPTADTLGRLSQSDPALRSRTVAALTRQELLP